MLGPQGCPRAALFPDGKPSYWVTVALRSLRPQGLKRRKPGNACEASGFSGSDEETNQVSGSPPPLRDDTAPGPACVLRQPGNGFSAGTCCPGATAESLHSATERPTRPRPGEGWYQDHERGPCQLLELPRPHCDARPTDGQRSKGTVTYARSGRVNPSLSSTLPPSSVLLNRASKAI